MRISLSVLSMVVIGLSYSPAHSAIFVPDGLSPGDEYQLVFVTNGGRQVYTPSILGYNNFVQGQAEAAGALTQEWGLEWRAIASTAGIDARDNAVVASPVYRLDGVKVADGFADMWDGTIQGPIGVNQYGNDLAVEVWTGSATDGSSVGVVALGMIHGYPTVGASNVVDGRWVNYKPAFQYKVKSLYALSEVIPARPAAAAKAVSYQQSAGTV